MGKTVRKICLVILLLMYHVCIYATHATLSSQIMMGESIKPNPHDFCMWFIILRSHTHSCDASNNEIISDYWQMLSQESVLKTSMIQQYHHVGRQSRFVIWHYGDQTNRRHLHIQSYRSPGFSRTGKIGQDHLCLKDSKRILHSTPMTFGGSCAMSTKQIQLKCNIGSCAICKIHTRSNGTGVWNFGSQHLFSIIPWPEQFFVYVQRSNHLGVFDGQDLSILNFFNIFWIQGAWCTVIPEGRCSS